MCFNYHLAVGSTLNCPELCKPMFDGSFIVYQCSERDRLEHDYMELKKQHTYMDVAYKNCLSEKEDIAKQVCHYSSWF